MVEEAMAEEAAVDVPLLPQAVRKFPYGWDTGFVWPPDVEENAATFAYARSVLEACLPAKRLPTLEPPLEVDSPWDDEPWPEWTEIRSILRSRMPCARHVTRRRMAAAEAECAARDLLTEDFGALWTLRICGWIAAETLYWCGLMVDDVEAITPWAMDLAEQYARRGLAAHQAVEMLRMTIEVRESREALGCLAVDGAIPEEIRAAAADGITG